MWVVLLNALRAGSVRDRVFDPSFVVVERVARVREPGCHPLKRAQGDLLLALRRRGMDESPPPDSPRITTKLR